MSVKATLKVEAKISRINGVLGAGAAAPTMGQTGIGDGRSAFSFDGGDFANIYSASLASAFDGAKGWLLCWARISDAAVWADGAGRDFFRLGVDGNNFVLFYKTETTNQIRCYYAAGGVFPTVGDTSLAASTAWFLFGMTWDKAADALKVYLNGAQIGTTQTGLGTWVGSLSASLCGLGSNGSTNTRPHKGLLAHCAVGAGAVLTAADVAAIYAARTGDMRAAIMARNPIAYWMLDDDSGTAAQDEVLFGWTPITSDVRANPPLRILYGIQNGGPLDRVAGTGTLDFGLDSGPGNSVAASGAYTSDHANVRDGFAIGAGVRAAFTFGGSTFYKFNGRLDKVLPEPGRYGGLGVTCQATDWFDEAAKHKVTLLAVQQSKRANENIATVVGAMTQKPAASTLATGQDVFPYAMDNSRDESTLALTEVIKNVMSELGYAYIIGDQASGGRLTFDDRHARLKTSTISASFSNNMVAMDVERGRDFMYNKVRVTTHPREVDSGSQILFRLIGAPTIPATASVALTGRYTDPNNIGAIRVGGVDMISPASGLDFIGNSASDASGADLTANLSVSASYGGNSVRYVVQNTGGMDLYLTTLQARGFGVYDKEPSRAEAEDLPSIYSYGEQVLELDMPYQSSPWVGDDVSRVLLSTGKTPRTETRRMEFVGNRSTELMDNGLRLEPGDRIKVVEDATGISNEFFINGVGIQHTADGETLFQFWLSPAGSTAFWLVGVAGFSELDQTTLLGY